MANLARKTRTIAMAVAVAIAFLATPARAAVTVAITPANGTVTPGTDFDLYVDVMAAGSQFNGFEMVVEFDPAALTFVPLSPTTNQQGCLMTGSCSGACGNTSGKTTPGPTAGNIMYTTNPSTARTCKSQKMFP